MSELDSFVQYGNRQSQDIRQTAAFLKTNNTSNRPTRIDQVKQIEASERQHNKQPQFIEIGFDDKSTTDKSSVSLAQAFKQKKRDLVERIDECSVRKPDKSQERLTFDKKELLHRRTNHGYIDKKDNAKTNPNESKQRQNQIDVSPQKTSKPSIKMKEGSVSPGPSKQIKLPPEALLSRLAKGEKHEVPKREMLELTQKNYKNLPEIQKKEKDRQKKEEIRQRMEKAKQYNRTLRENIGVTSNQCK